MDNSKLVFDSQVHSTMAGSHRQPNVIFPPNPRNIRRKSHMNRSAKALMAPPRQIPRSSGSQRDKPTTIVTEKVLAKQTEQQAITTQPKEDQLQTDVEDIVSESSGRAACHLRSYIRGAVLPGIEGFRIILPPRGQRSCLNWLQIPFNHERKIDVITKISTGALRADINNFIRNYIYDVMDVSATSFATAAVPSLISASESLSLPSKSQRQTPQIFEPENSPSLPTTPNSLGEIATWVVELPLRTVQRAIHLSHPETAKWCFDEVPWMNHDLYQVYVWRRHPTMRKETIQDSLAVIVQAPWILSWQDLQDVVKCTNSLPQTNPYAGMHPSYLIKHRVWDLIRDTCQILETQYFILTTYEGWVFGRFDTSNSEVYLNPVNGIKLEADQYPLTVDSQDCWSKCSVSNVLDASRRLPNVVEGILYWVATSMKLEGSLNTESNSSTTIKMEDVSVLRHSPSVTSTPHPHSPPPSPRIPVSRPNHQTQSEIDSPVYICRRTKNRDKRSYSPYSRSGRPPKSSHNTPQSPIGPAVTEGGPSRPRSLFMMVKHFMRWLSH